jgi:hypothetical protein
MQHHSKLAPDEAARFIQSWYVTHPSHGENMSHFQRVRRRCSAFPRLLFALPA